VTSRWHRAVDGYYSDAAQRMTELDQLCATSSGSTKLAELRDQHWKLEQSYPLRGEPVLPIIRPRHEVLAAIEPREGDVVEVFGMELDAGAVSRVVLEDEVIEAFDHAVPPRDLRAELELGAFDSADADKNLMAAPADADTAERAIAPEDPGLQEDVVGPKIGMLAAMDKLTRRRPTVPKPNLDRMHEIRTDRKRQRVRAA
jgi:hypothetical protein